MESYHQSQLPPPLPPHEPSQASRHSNDGENLTSLYDDLDSFLQELSFDSPASPINTITTDLFSSSSQLNLHTDSDRVSTYGENFTINHDYYSDDDHHTHDTSSTTGAETDSATSSNSQLQSCIIGHKQRQHNTELEDDSSNDVPTTPTRVSSITTPSTSPTPRTSTSTPQQPTHLLRSVSNGTYLSSSSNTSSVGSSPLLAPSLLSISRSTSLGSSVNREQQQTQQQLQQQHILTTRTSSLTREFTSNSKRSDSMLSDRSHASINSNHTLPPLPASPRMYSTPNSPLARIIETDTHSIHELMYGNHGANDNDDDNDTNTFPNHALVSALAIQFVAQVKSVTKRRKIFTTAEYPNSFNGEEAVNIVRSILPSGLPSSFYLKVTRALMHTCPPVICPITYSEKSARRNTLYQTNHEVYLLVDGDIPQGVYTPLTRCYTHYCLPGQGGCYAPCCPNKPKSEKLKHNGLDRHGSMSSSVASSHETTMSRAWSATVAKEVLQSTPNKEIARQEAIHELIYTEEDYVRDLNLLDELFATSLRNAQCIEPERRDSFCDNIFNNYLELLTIHRDLYRDLRDYQSTCQANNVSGFVDQIGDIFYYHLGKFSRAYQRYGPHVVLAEYAIKKEMTSNILFQNFVHEREKQAETRKLPFRHFIILPVTRLQRYPLLIGAILKKTPDDHPDKAALTKCSDLLRQIASAMDEETANSKNTLRIFELNDRIRCKATEPHDLQLLAPGRLLLHEGSLSRRNHVVVESTEIYILLFDHMLLMTRRDTNSIRQVLALPEVTQMAIIPGPHILMILADKTLYAYALEPLDPTSPKRSNDKPNIKVAQHISYFNAGTCHGRPLVIAMKKRGLDSHFKAYEPVCGDLRDPANSKFLVMKTGLFSKTPSWFKVYKEFYVGADSSAVHFLKARIVVVCPRGFEVIDLENLSMNRNLPDLQHPEFAFVQQRADLKPLGLFKCRQHYLLCYDAFAFLVDTHGSFVQESYAWIAWEGTPQAIAFYYPYVVAFDARFVEIRHVETGELVQILAGVHMRCLQFTNDTFSPVIHGCMAHPFKPEYQYVFQLMAKFEPPADNLYKH
ncbi:hypothetical protein [Absidia glauca]|uniref:DH domain-containing protein n=1 Tax=Absidia glauca TaxID=4829 RepID=A0A163JMC5_ABSGL|nr:hypothetical protein [Absidia glauca]